MAPRVAWVWMVLAAAQVTRLAIDDPGADGAYAYRASFSVDAPAASVRDAYVNQCEGSSGRSRVFTVCQVFAREGSTWWTYVMTEIPALAPRDYVLRRTVDEDLGPRGTGVFRMHWHADTARSPPPRKGIVRMTVNDGTFTVIPAGGRSLVEVQGRLSPGTAVPSWVVDSVARVIVPRGVARLEKRAQQQAGTGTVDALLARMEVKPLVPPWPGPSRRVSAR